MSKKKSSGIKVCVGMSGGVDSSVCAWLLKEQGYEVCGMTMGLWEEEEEVCRRAGHVGCCSSSAVDDAMEVCARLSIPFYTFSFKELFREKVVDYFCSSYINGQTPNPCIACNRYLKWGAMRKAAKELGAEYIATGHYARIAQADNGRYAVTRSKAVAKDQSYVLYSLSQDDLKHTLMPIGDYTKEEVRGIAYDIGLSVSSKPDSQDICFVPDGDYAGFVERMSRGVFSAEPGDFVLSDGTVAGRHKGIIHYTVGQRKGLGLSLGRPVFVNRIDPIRNEVVIGENEDCFADGLVADEWNGMADEVPEPGKVYTGRIRYSDRGTACTARMIGKDTVEVRFLKPVRAITPGQAVVLDDGEMLIGGGRILKSL